MLNRLFSFLGNSIIAVMILAVIAVILIPMPGVLLDILIGLVLIFAALILLIGLYSQKLKTFSLFPTILLIITSFSLALSISAARPILTKGADFDGRLILFVSSIAGSGVIGLVVGTIIYALFVLILLSIVVKGTTRVSEIAARFALDRMPVRLLGIEVEVSTGTISEEEARIKKSRVQFEADYFGAMDGAAKFVRGNVKVNMFITLTIIAGGIIIGKLADVTVIDALLVYVPLAIGHGIVFMLPALFLSVAMGINAFRQSLPG